MNIITLLAEVGAGSPCGVDLRADLGQDSLYLRLKDARAQARAAEREAEATSETAAVPPAWQVVRTLAIEALSRHSKDIEVATWLLEALVRNEGFVGLAAGFTLIEGLIARYWPGLHSPDEEDDAARLSPLAGLNGVGGEGPLLPAIRMVPLIPGVSHGRHSLWHHVLARRDAGGALGQELLAAQAAVGSEAMRRRAVEAKSAYEAFLKLVATLTERCGEHAPPSSKIRNLLEEVLDVYRLLLGETNGVQGPVQSTIPVTQQPGGEVVDARSSNICSREEAFAELLRIAEFFRRTEPHSLISYSLETLVRRGRMNLVNLLEELLPDANSRAQFLKHAGIHPNGDGRGEKKH